jgi:hypothetical protein
VAYSILLVVIAAFYYRVSNRIEIQRRSILGYGAIILTGMLVLTAWRGIYFHSFLPNTVYAKVGLTMSQFVRGAYYVLHFFLVFGGAAFVLMGTAAYLLVKRRRDAVLPIAVLAALFMASQVLLGGDFMAMGRFMVPLVPLMGILLAATLCPGAGSLRRLRGITSLLLVLAVFGLNMLPTFDLYAAPYSWRAAVHFRWNNRDYVSEKQYWKVSKRDTEQWTVVGKLLRSISKPDQSLVAGGIGAIGYYSKLRIFDIFGLVSREVARSEVPRDTRSAGHDKSVDAFYFYPRHPDYFYPRLVPRKDLEDWKMTLVRNILQRSKSRTRSQLRERFERLQDEYTIHTHPVSYEYEGEPMVFITYVLKERMPKEDAASE